MLANSIKKAARCVAGRELTLGEPPAFGGWLRPISNESEGELQPKHMTLTDGTSVLPLQVIDIPLGVHAANAAHPEDWFVTGDKWNLVETLTSDKLLALVETPASLWLEPGQVRDRVSPAFIATSQNHQSLYLVRPQNLRFRYWREAGPGYTRKKTRAAFSYQGAAYDMSFTDPEASALYCRDYPASGQAPKEVTPPFNDNCVLCVSLTPEFRGSHYKVVATVIALP